MPDHANEPKTSTRRSDMIRLWLTETKQTAKTLRDKPLGTVAHEINAWLRDEKKISITLKPGDLKPIIERFFEHVDFGGGGRGIPVLEAAVNGATYHAVLLLERCGHDLARATRLLAVVAAFDSRTVHNDE